MLVNPRPSNGPYCESCAEIKEQAPAALSGLYDILFGNQIITVYCEMALHGGGFTFIPRDAVLRGTLTGLVRKLFTDKSKVLLRFQNKDGKQPHTLITQLPKNKGTELGVLMHHYTEYTRPLNSYMNDYIFLGILPASKARNKDVQGFCSNGKQVSFSNCDKNPNSYFAFFPNHREQVISSYHNNNLVYERSGVAVDWRKTGIPSYGHRRLPLDFFFMTELHFGGCGCYTSSDRWTDAFGAAIGLR